MFKLGQCNTVYQVLGQIVEHFLRKLCKSECRGSVWPEPTHETSRESAEAVT